MSAPTQARHCEHCKQTVTPKLLRTTVSGAQPILVALCRCDYLTCANCEATVYDRKAQRCPSCGNDPAIKRHA